MRQLKLPFLLLLLVAILLGVAWGLKIQKNTAKRKVPEADATTLKVLALKNAFPTAVIRVFEGQANIKVQLAEEPTPKALLIRLEREPHFDLVTLLNFQTAIAASTLKIQPLKLQEIAGSSSLSPDFLDLPGSASPTVVPLLWGLKTAEAATSSEEPAENQVDNPSITWTQDVQVPAEGAALWILSLSLGGKSENPVGAKKFIEFLLKPVTAAVLSQQGHQASCNKAVESSTKVPAELKPSHLRKIPLGTFKIAEEKSSDHGKH